MNGALKSPVGPRRLPTLAPGFFARGELLMAAAMLCVVVAISCSCPDRIRRLHAQVLKCLNNICDDGWLPLPIKLER
jgi:hypothetical protein